jgi:signal recognition particle subunit SRP68
MCIYSLQLLLLEAERAWAFSQELITSALQPVNDDRASSLRHSATGRFRRAVNWSTQLLSLCQSLHASSRLSVDSLLQITVYTLILNGRFLRYRDEFEDGLLQLSVARNLLDELADRASNSRDQALATLFADDIGAEIRYCAHELGRSKAYDVDGIVKELASKHRNKIVEGCDILVAQLKREGETSGKEEVRKKLDTLVWEDQPVPVRNPELVDVLLKVQEAETRLEGADGQERAGKGEIGKKKQKGSGSKKSVAAYDAILLALSDAEDVARKLAEAQQVLYLAALRNPVILSLLMNFISAEWF